MPKTRKPATAEEVTDFFAAEPLETANLVYRLVGAALKKRQPAAAPKKARKPSGPKPPTAIPGAAADPTA